MQIIVSNRGCAYRRVQQGKVPEHKVGWHWRFYKAAISEWMQNGADEGKAQVIVRGHPQPLKAYIRFRFQAMQTRFHSPCAAFSPRRWNRRNHNISFTMPNTVSTVAFVRNRQPTLRVQARLVEATSSLTEGSWTTRCRTTSRCSICRSIRPRRGMNSVREPGSEVETPPQLNMSLKSLSIFIALNGAASGSTLPTARL